MSASTAQSAAGFSLKRLRALLAGQVGCFAVSFFSLSFTPLLTRGGRGERAGTILLASLFWFFFLAGIVLVILAGAYTKQKRAALRGKGVLPRHLPGVICFRGASRACFSLPRVIFYAVFAVGAVLLVCDLLFSFLPGSLLPLTLSITLFAFALHAVADGETYQTYAILKNSHEHLPKRMGHHE